MIICYIFLEYHWIVGYLDQLFRHTEWCMTWLSSFKICALSKHVSRCVCVCFPVFARFLALSAHYIVIVYSKMTFLFSPLDCLLSPKRLCNRIRHLLVTNKSITTTHQILTLSYFQSDFTVSHSCIQMSLLLYFPLREMLLMSVLMIRSQPALLHSDKNIHGKLCASPK